MASFRGLEDVTPHQQHGNGAAMTALERNHLINGMRRYYKDEEKALHCIQRRRVEDYVYRDRYTGDIRRMNVVRVHEEQRPRGIDLCENRMQRFNKRPVKRTIRKDVEIMVYY